jgi:hypothetical protein
VGATSRFREAGQGLRGEGVGREARSLESKKKKMAMHKEGSIKGRGKAEAVEKRKRPSSARGTRPISSSLEQEWAVAVRAAQL